MDGRLYRDPNSIDKPGDKVRWEEVSKGTKAKGTVKKVKPDGTRIVKTGVNTIVKKNPKDLK